MITRLLAALLLASGLVSTLPAQKPKKAPASKASEGTWVKVPDAWLITRFVQSNVGPRNSYKVGLILPPGGATPKVTRTSGRPEVDGIAFDYAKHLVSQNSQLREMNKTKELVFNLELIPPMQDAGEKSEIGRAPIPPGEKFHMPSPKVLMNTKANRGEGGLISRATYMVVFPPQGGYAKEALVLSSGGKPDNDLFHLRNAVINWKTSIVSDRPTVRTFEYTSKRMGFGGRFTNE